MPIVKEIEIPTEPCCGNCAAWKQTQGLNGECHLLPPVPMFAGFQQMPQVAGLQLNGKLPPQPIILAAFPAVNANNICRQWAPDQPPLAIEDAPRPEFVPDCPVEDASYALPREIEGAKHQDEIPGRQLTGITQTADDYCDHGISLDANCPDCKKFFANY